MPYEIIKVKNGYKIKNKITGKTYSKMPMSYENALKQMRLLYMVGDSAEYVMKMKPSAYKSMKLSQYGLSKPVNKNNKGALQRWKDEQWLNLNALLQGLYLPCGKKYKGQKDPTVCRPRKKISEKTPTPLAEQLTKKQIKKAIEQKKLGYRIDWKNI